MTTTVREPLAPARPRAAAPPTVAAAVLLATAPGADGEPAALLAWEDTTLVARLAAQAASVGAEAVHVVTRPEWVEAVERAVGTSATVVPSTGPAEDFRAVARIAQRADGGLLVAHGEILTQREALAGIAADPRVSTGVLATVGRIGRPFAQRIRTARGRVVSAASPYHGVNRPTATFLGVLKVSDADRPALVAAAESLAALTADGLPEGWQDELDRKTGIWRAVLARAAWRQEMDQEQPGETEFDDDTDVPELELPEDPADIVLSAEDEAEIARRARVVPNDVAAMLTTALVRDGTQVAVNHLRKLFWARPITAEGVERAAADIQEYDEDKVLLDSAVKAADGFFTTFFVSTYSKYIARWAARRGLTPNQITMASVIVGFLAAAAFATGERWGLVAGAILLQIAFTTDCVDGQLARYTRQFSKLGAWLDSVFDRTKEYAVFAGLAIGYSASHDDSVWLLAGAALTLQTFRHQMDFAFGAARQEVIGAAEHPPLAQPSDRVGAGIAPKTPARAVAAPTPAGEAAPSGGAASIEPAAPAAVDPPRPVSLPRRVLGLWRKLDRWPGMVWIKRMAAFPIGERFAVISITAALFDAKVTFVVLLAWGGFGLAYTFAGRFLRSVAR
ncbi:MAG TPA: CDP-alcohol phosphatidyltransferase family protein [Solirubrobacteraceae bacterium]|nr:CDP-alcohol phosphatidyltransferase family protein [Solirubrobacteraceae bacterium]